MDVKITSSNQLFVKKIIDWNNSFTLKIIVWIWTPEVTESDNNLFYMEIVKKTDYLQFFLENIKCLICKGNKRAIKECQMSLMSVKVFIQTFQHNTIRMYWTKKKKEMDASLWWIRGLTTIKFRAPPKSVFRFNQPWIALFFLLSGLAKICAHFNLEFHHAWNHDPEISMMCAICKRRTFHSHF